MEIYLLLVGLFKTHGKHIFFIKIFGIYQKGITFAPATGTIAQLVEQRTENPCVPGSIPGGTTTKSPKLTLGFIFAYTLATFTLL